MTTLYNHNSLGNADKPLITNLQFKQVCDRIRNGDITAYEKVYQHFSLESNQQSSLRTLYLEVKNKNNPNRA